VEIPIQAVRKAQSPTNSRSSGPTSVCPLTTTHMPIAHSRAVATQPHEVGKYPPSEDARITIEVKATTIAGEIVNRLLVATASGRSATAL
jgi:hypothetical protein